METNKRRIRKFRKDEISPDPHLHCRDRRRRDPHPDHCHPQKSAGQQGYNLQGCEGAQLVDQHTPYYVKAFRINSFGIQFVPEPGLAFLIIYSGFGFGNIKEHLGPKQRTPEEIMKKIVCQGILFLRFRSLLIGLC